MLDLLQEAFLIGSRPAEGARREPLFHALGDAFIATFDSADRTQTALVEGIRGVSDDPARARMRAARNIRPVGVPAFTAAAVSR